MCNINFVNECNIGLEKFNGSDSDSCSERQPRTSQKYFFNKFFSSTTNKENICKELALLVQSALTGYNEFQLLDWEYRIEDKPILLDYITNLLEHIVDLLKSQIRMTNNKEHNSYISNLTEEINIPEELHKFLLTVPCNRTVTDIQLNKRSSKLHLVTKIALIRTNHSKEENSLGNLNLTDLVENISCSNSKFTHLLMQSLGGNSKIFMLLNIFSLDEYCNKTLDSLRFASKVNHCRSDSAKERD